MGIIYQCKNTVTNKTYIGITIRSLNERKWEHIKELNNGFKKGIWQEEYNVDKTCFEFSVLEICENKYLCHKEIEYIRLFNSLEPNGYNKKLNSSDKSNIDYSLSSKYSVNALIHVVQLLLSNNPIYTIEQIAGIVDIPEDSICDLARIKSFKWIQSYIPEEYQQLLNIHESKIPRPSFLQKQKLQNVLFLLATTDLTAREISEITNATLDQVRDIFRNKSCRWLQNLMPIEYEIVSNKYNKSLAKRNTIKIIIDITTGTEYRFTSNSDISRQLNIDHRRLSDLLNGKVTTISDTNKPSKKYTCGTVINPL